MRLFVALLLCGLLAGGAVQAKPAKPDVRPASAASESLEVTADQSLEWYQNQHLYVARGNAKAVRGDVVFEADILSAHAREAEGGAEAKDKKQDPEMGSIDRLMAEGNVKISDPKQQVFGDKAVYDLDQRVATVTGGNLKYVTSGGDIVTARDSMDYYEAKDMAVARGNARAVRADGRKIDADILTAHFTTNAAGQKEMTQITAEGHVVVTTQGDVAMGEHAVYDAKRNVATLNGHVRITRQDTQLAGDRAEVDFGSGESRLLATGKDRVRALLPSRSAPVGASTGAATTLTGAVP